MTRQLLSRGKPVLASEPDLPAVYKRAIERALRWAWSEVCRLHPEIVRNGREEEITERIEWMLNLQIHGERAAPGLRLFDAVARGAKQRTSDNRIEKAPDLVLRPPVHRAVRNRSHWGMFVECKIIDGGASVTRYCRDGVQRFTSGEYCARMKSGMLLAYARDSQRPYAALAEPLREYGTTRHDGRRGAEDVSESMHTRNALPQPCVDIALIHLWLTPGSP